MSNHAYTYAELAGPTRSVRRADLEPLLAALSCPNPLRAIRDFEQYGVAKFAYWEWYRCPCPPTMYPYEIRRVDT